MSIKHREHLEEEHVIAVSVSSVSRAFSRLGLPLKKSLPAAERDEDERAGWLREARRIAPERFVFVDECVLGMPP